VSKWWVWPAIIAGVASVGGLNGALRDRERSSLTEEAYARRMQMDFENTKKQLPMRIDGSRKVVDLTLDGKTVTYKVIEDLSGPLLEDGFTKQELADAARESKQVGAELLCKTPGFKTMLVDHGYSLAYSFYSQKNQFLFSYAITGSDCKNVAA